MVSSYCNFFGSIAYPSVAECGLRVNKLGKTSVEWEIALFEQGSEDVRAVGGFTHVFCDRKKNKPQPNGMCLEVRQGLEKVLVQPIAKL
jgi:acyl-CoA thioester hydrolase